MPLPKISDILGKAFNTTDNSIKTTQELSSDEVVDLLISIAVQDITITTDTELYDTTVTVTGSEPTDGHIVCFKEDSAFYQGFILSHSANGGDWDIVLDTPLDYAYTTAGGCSEREANLATAVGSLASPVIASVSPSDLDVDWKITRFTMTMVHDSNGADTLFGSLAALTNGIVFRRVNTTIKNLFNAKNNGDLKLRTFDVEYTDAIGGTKRGTRVRRSFGGDDKNGTTQELLSASSDTFECVIQDDLTADTNELNSLYICVQGKVK